MYMCTHMCAGTCTHAQVCANIDVYDIRMHMYALTCTRMHKKVLACAVTPKIPKKLFTLLDLCVSFLRRGHFEKRAAKNHKKYTDRFPGVVFFTRP